MEANELMIGDWVLYEGETKQIVAIPSDNEVIFDGTLEKYVSDCLPIPLTPEILEKNGFKDVLHPRFNERKLCKVWYDYSIQINVDNKSAHMVISPLAAIRNRRADYIFPNPDYVHELQHILKLLGITKSIQV